MSNDIGYARPDLLNCLVWSNYQLLSRQTPKPAFRGASASYSNVQGSWPGVGNIDLEPLVNPYGYLRKGSICIGKGDPNSVVEMSGLTDVHGENRVHGSYIDIGADEFWDDDDDGLPDWWEKRYFGDPNDDAFDRDGLTNLEEYNYFSSDPVRKPLYVDKNASDVSADGSVQHPFSALQRAIDAAKNGDTIFIAPGTYKGAGNSHLDFHHKTLILRKKKQMEGNVLLDASEAGQAINFLSTVSSSVALDGFTIQNGVSDMGGALRLESGRFVLQDCILKNSTASRASILSCSLSHLCIGSVKIDRDDYDPDEPNPPNSGSFQFSNITIDGKLILGPGVYEIISTSFNGPGSIILKPKAYLKILDISGNQFSSIGTHIMGPGTIEIEAGQELVFDGETLINLRGENNEPNGVIKINGALVVGGNASVMNANIEVLLLRAGDRFSIINNDIRLNEASTGFGGEFFIRENATIQKNNIISEGDRYLDLDPNPATDQRPTVSENHIEVIINQGVQGKQGTLLELRAKDYDFDSIDTSGAHHIHDSRGFTKDPSENWVLDKLTLKAGSKLNLTNRQGFEYQDLNECYPETVYVKKLVLGPGSVLNTALQTLYYQDLILTDSNGLELALGRNPARENIPQINGAEITDIPLLGFSLVIIAMDDSTPSPHNEFDIRVRKRLKGDPNDPKEPAGRIERRTDIDPNQGHMEMSTSKESSIAAKGAFARAGDEDITIEFEYLFQAADSSTELVIYLSDHPEVGQRLRKVATIRPPAEGRPGAINSSSFGVFSGTFPKGDLNFTRGTYVELELRGKDASVWIDNWDPKINCIGVCQDYSGEGDTDVYDYILLLAESNLTEPSDSAFSKGCLDLFTDSIIGPEDALTWEARFETELMGGCPKATEDEIIKTNAITASHHVQGSIFPMQLSQDSCSAMLNSLLVLGKGGMSYGYITQDNYLCGIDNDTKSIDSCLINVMGHLIVDGNDKVYCVDPVKGLVNLEQGVDPHIVVKPNTYPYGDYQVSIGLLKEKDPVLTDAVFHPHDRNIVYIVPVRVVTDTDDYLATAKLNLDANNDGIRGDISILRLYGANPHDDSSIDHVSGHGIYEPDTQHLREVELDAEGKNLFVLSATRINQNNWLSVYEAESNDPYRLEEDPVAHNFQLNQPNSSAPSMAAPRLLLVSSAREGRLYLTSPVEGDSNDLEANVYCFSFAGSDPDTIISSLYAEKTIYIDCNRPGTSICDSAVCVEGRSVSMLTSMTEAKDGTLYAVGYTMPKFKKDAVFPEYGSFGWFTTPILATIPDTTNTRRYKTEDVSTWDTASRLALPQSIVFVEPKLKTASWRKPNRSEFNRFDFNQMSLLAEHWISSSDIE